MGRTLKRTVIKAGVTYARGTAETSELSELIPNPAAWEGEPDPAPKKRASRSSRSSSSSSNDSGSDGGAEKSEPPRGGEGATADAWREYATGLGIEVPEDAGRDDIVALVDARG
jgi:hypothetical protein